MKMRHSHSVPLSRQAVALIEDIWPLSEGGEPMFPSIRTRKKPLSENAFNVSLRRMGYSKDEVTEHGFRVTASTILNNRGYDPDVIEAVLAHQDSNVIRRAYTTCSTPRSLSSNEGSKALLHRQSHLPQGRTSYVQSPELGPHLRRC